MTTEIKEVQKELEELIDYISTQQKRFERALIWLSGSVAKTIEDKRIIVMVAKQILQGEAVARDVYRIKQ